MLFNSFEFLLFFPVVTLLYFLLPHRYRWMLLLAASCVFYMFFKAVYILILFFTIVVDYAAGICIEDSKTPERKKVFLLASLVANIGVLAVFKYFNFLNDNITSLSQWLGYENHIPYLHILLPIGLSFHTFQAMSYTFEVYRGHQQAERHFGIYALYVMFYPQLVAGPIERPQNILHQFYEKHYVDYHRIVSGLQLMAWGLFKKVVVADNLALMVDNVYNKPTAYTGISLVLATCFFAFQVFCDFSGYSDMAIGSAQVMGFTLMKNFNRPYLATSIPEFWSRWHISLSTWFRDYLYIPLGGNRVPKWRWYFNLLVVFLVSGLWHGASWTFIVWGALHGFYQVSGFMTKKLREKVADQIGLTAFPRLHHTLQLLSVFVLVSFAWIFFRATSLQDAVYIAYHAVAGLGNIKELAEGDWQHLVFLDTSPKIFAVGLGSVILMSVIHRQQNHLSIRQLIATRPVWQRWGLYYLFLLVVLIFGQFGAGEFIYFQF
ncbi:MBOAT family protein [Pontibacter sp. SGAir0037]|uniref:MBOAT family O-acyltransferase n=1 Tax=Pontibacter sp. SGAir0037 TaxID=2571030 RepID=UPI0010CD082D|nr:MBOAT family O-acyltransferase [Pontibacter sp. SGAir0037]QCR22388.1 membrane-bound O-acyltransferase family protein [Pontibacter sp. SGAir0037]